MLKRIISFFKDKGISLEMLNILLGILMLAAGIAYLLTRSAYALYLIILCGALMNVVNGFKNYRQREKKNMGISMIVFGVCIVLFFIILLALGIV